MISHVVIVSTLILLAGYLFYGRYLSRQMDLDGSRQTPSCQVNDGADFVPAKPSLLLGQHFSAIAAAGPIVGPILAGIWFGWMPALLWILFGSIFIGGKNAIYAIIPMIFMMTMTLWSLALLIMPFLTALSDPLQILALKPDAMISSIFGIVLLSLSLMLVFEAIRILILKPVEIGKV